MTYLGLILARKIIAEWRLHHHCLCLCLCLWLSRGRGVGWHYWNSMFDKDIITAHNSYKLFLHNTFSGQKIFKTNEEIHPSEWLNIAKSATDSGSECLNSNNIFESFDHRGQWPVVESFKGSRQDWKMHPRFCTALVSWLAHCFAIFLVWVVKY